MSVRRSLVRTHWGAAAAILLVVVGSTTLMTSAAGPAASARSVFVPITPCRIMDTRPAPDNVGIRTSPLGASDTHTIDVRGVNGNCTIPTAALGLSMNITIANPTANSFLTVFPADVTRPLASNLNWVGGQAATPNAVTTNISANGKISFFNLAGTVDVLADIVGYYAPAPGHIVPIDVFASFVNPTFFGSPAPGMAFGRLMSDAAEEPIFVSFVVPPDLTSGSTMTLDVFYQAEQTGCSIVIGPEFYSVSRIGAIVPAPFPSAGMTSIGGAARQVPTLAHATGAASFLLDYPVGGGLLAGDIITFRLDRLADVCTGSIVVVGAQVSYS
jgi:hypothetical protein